MTNLLEDIQCAGLDTRPPMLDRTDFASWQQRIRLYCRGKENGVNILKSIDEGPFQMGTFRETLAEGNEGALHLGPERPRLYFDLSPEDKDKYNADIRATNILLQGLPKDIYSFINHYTDAKDIWDNVKMLLEGTAGYGEAQNKVGNANPGQARHIKCYNCNAQENGVVLDEEHLLFLAGGQDNAVDEDVDEQPIQDLALNVDNVFQANDCDAFDSDVDEAPMAQTMFMANLSSADPVYDKVGNMIPYDQYVKDNAVPVVQSNVSSVLNDAYMMIYNDNVNHHAQSVSKTTRNTVVDNSLTAELATYKEQVELYERWARFELTEREQKIDEQLRIVIDDRNIKEENLKKELHSVKLQLASTINHNKSMVEEVTSLKKDFKQKENKYLEEFLDMKALKEKVEDKLYKQDQSLQTVHMLCKPKPYYDELNKIAEITKKKMNAKMKDQECVQKKVNITPPDYSKENYLATFTPQKQLTPEQIFWSQDLIKMKAEALKTQATASRPIKALTVFMLAMNFELNVSSFTKMHDAHTSLKARCLELEVELSNLRDKIQKDNHDELIKWFSNLEVNHLNLQLKYQNLKESFGNNTSPPARDVPDFDSVFVIEKMKASIQGKDNAIKKLRMQISQLKETRSEADRTLDFRTLDFQITQLTEKIKMFHPIETKLSFFRAENRKIKQHYKELYDSIKITCAKHLE
ncbi:hypothetical protein Tco_1361103 [Tanacetum coccineum]